MANKGTKSKGKEREEGENIGSKGHPTSIEEKEENKLVTNVNELETNRHADVRR